MIKDPITNKEAQVILGCHKDTVRRYAKLNNVTTEITGHPPTALFERAEIEALQDVIAPRQIDTESVDDVSRLVMVRPWTMDGLKELHAA